MNKKLIFLTLSLLAVTMLQAQNIIRPKVECPNGIYVNSYNGVLFYQRPDVSVANRNMRLEAVFYYNSSSNRKNYGYGNGWSLGSELRFVNDSLGVIIEQGDGRQDLYTRYGNSFEAPAGVFSTLSFEGDGYLLTYKDGTKYYFTDTVSKKVTQVKDRYDNAITYIYQEGNLATASDISGRSLYFTWSNDLLSGIRTSFDDRTWSYQYDENGNLTAVTDPMGYTVHYAYNKDNRIKTFTDAEGYSTHISYNSDGMAHRVKTDLTDKSIRYELAKRQTIFIDYMTDANNQYTKYVWDEQGRLVEIENVNTGAHTKFAYDDDNNMISREDANGNAYTYTYDENGNQLSATDPLGYSESFTYEDTFNKMTSYTDKMGHYYNYQYDEHGDLLQMNGPLNYTISLSYNQYGQLQSLTDANYNTYHYYYDSQGNLYSMTDPLGNVTLTAYDLSGRPISQTQPNGAITTYSYDNNENLALIVDALNNKMQITYDKKGNMTSMQDANSNTMHFQYDALGQLIQQTDQVGACYYYLYNSAGKLSKIEDALGYKNRLIYDDQNLINLSIGTTNDTTFYCHDNVGNLVGLITPNGRVVTTAFDAMNRVVAQSDQLGVLYTCNLDANGNILNYNDAEGNIYSFEYDALGRIVTKTDALGNSIYYSYDLNGNLLTVLDKNGNATSFTYDALNRKNSKTDAMGNVTQYNYDDVGNLVQVTNALGNTTQFEYDLKGQLVKIIYADGKTNRFWYDGNGNLIIREDESGAKTYYIYDEVNQLTQIDYPNHSSDFFSYDLKGQLLSAANENAQVSYSYDALGRLSSESINNAITNYIYDDDYRYFVMGYPSGKSIRQELDVRNRVHNVIDQENNTVLSSIEYNGLNKVIQNEYGNGISTTYSYDACGNLIEINDNNGVLHYEIGYDGEGNIISKKDLINEAHSEIFTYNNNGQLIGYLEGEMDVSNVINNPINSIQYELNPLGGMTARIFNGISTQYSLNPLNAITSISGEVEYQYDVNGNLIGDENHTYQYNSKGQLVSVDNGNTASYIYDALGRRIQKTIDDDSGTHTENYSYSGTKIIDCFDGLGNNLFSTCYSMTGQPLQMICGSQSYYYHSDQTHSTIAMTSQDGSVSERYFYNPSGQVSFMDNHGSISFHSQINNNTLLYGNTYDPETGFHNRITSESGISTTTKSDIGMSIQKNNAILGAGSANNLYLYTTTNKGLNWDNTMDFILEAGDQFIDFILEDRGFADAYIQDFIFARKAVDPLFYQIPNDDSFLKELQNLDKLRKTAENINTGVEIVKAFVGIPEMVRSVSQTNSFADEFALYGDYASGLLGILYKPLGLIDKGTKMLTGGEYGLFEQSARGWGMIADLGMDALEDGCERFKQTGYENATWRQKAFSKIAKILPTNEYFYATGLPITDRQAKALTNTLNFAERSINSIKTWIRGEKNR